MTRDYRAKGQNYLDLEERRIRHTYHPQIRVDGEWCYLPDDSTPSKLMEATSVKEAHEMAKAALRA